MFAKNWICLVAMAVALFVAGAAQAAVITDAIFSDPGQIRSASNNPYFGAGLTQNVAAVNLTWHAPLDMAYPTDREEEHGALAGGTLNGIAFHDILLDYGANTATGIPVANALAGVTMDYTLNDGINRNFPAALFTGADAGVAYNVSATNVARNGHSIVTFHGLTPNNNVYVQLIGAESSWGTPVEMSLNGGTAVSWSSIAATLDCGWLPIGPQDGTYNPALLGITGTTSGSGDLAIDVYSTGGNFYYGVGAITVAQETAAHEGDIPEPATMILLGAGLAGLLRRARRRLGA